MRAQTVLYDLFFNYYGVDWVVFVLIVIHLWMLGNQYKTAFLLGAFASCFGLILGLLINSLASVLMNVVFFFMHLRAFSKWSSEFTNRH